MASGVGATLKNLAFTDYDSPAPVVVPAEAIEKGKSCVESLTMSGAQRHNGELPPLS
jgi:hypothetical protein